MRHLLPLSALLLAACNATDEPRAPGGVTQGEAAALNDAAVMLDGNAVAADALTTEPKER